MRKRYRTTSGMRRDPSGELVPWERTVELEEDPQKADLREIFCQVAERQELLEDETRFHYDEISSKRIDPEVLKYANVVLDYFCRRYELPAVRLRWCTRQSPEERRKLRKAGALDCVDGESFDSPVGGWARPGGKEIWIEVGRSFWQTAFTIAHELVHTQQPLSGMTVQEREYSADRLAAVAVAELQAALYR